MKNFQDCHGRFYRNDNNNSFINNTAAQDDEEEKRETKQKEKFKVVEHFYSDDSTYMLMQFNGLGMVRKHVPGFPVYVLQKPCRFEKACNVYNSIKETGE